MEVGSNVIEAGLCMESTKLATGKICKYELSCMHTPNNQRDPSTNKRFTANPMLPTILEAQLDTAVQKPGG